MLAVSVTKWQLRSTYSLLPQGVQSPSDGDWKCSKHGNKPTRPQKARQSARSFRSALWKCSGWGSRIRLMRIYKYMQPFSRKYICVSWAMFTCIKHKVLVNIVAVWSVCWALTANERSLLGGVEECLPPHLLCWCLMTIVTLSIVRYVITAHSSWKRMENTSKCLHM